MKKTLKAIAMVVSLATLTGFAHAANPGAYLGLGLGASEQDTPKLTTPDKNVSISHTKSGVGGRVFGGYNFNQYFGVEAGFAHYAKSRYKVKTGEVRPSLDYTMNALDVVGKAYLPLNESFNVYGLAGAAYVKSTNKLNVNVPKNHPNYASSSITNNKVRPIVGVGASYNIQSNVVTNLELSHIQGSGNLKTSSKAIPSANLLTLNVAYNFG